jgi:hypothetical protein
MNEKSIAFIPRSMYSVTACVRTLDMGRISPGDYFGGRNGFLPRSCAFVRVLPRLRELYGFR